MALVTYDNSDSSEYEDEENYTNVTQIKKEVLEPTLTEANVQNGVNELGQDGLFNQLPQPSSKKKECIEEDDEFLHKKESLSDTKPKSRIKIPSLNDFKDVDKVIPSSRTKVNNEKKSGLLSILPQPKNGVKSTFKSLIPNSVAQKPQSTTVKKKCLPSPVQINDTKPIVTEYSDESDDELENDFFSFKKPVELPADLPMPEEPEVEMVGTTKQPRSIESFFKKDDAELETNVEETDDFIPFSEQVYDVPHSSNDMLDEEAILKLCGARGKRKREEIQIVDVNQQEVLDEARQWLLKGLMDDTSKRQSASKRKGNEPTNQQKRKHQITYLAHQAKANEAELQNQWANNRMSKRQTQSKYGF